MFRLFTLVALAFGPLAGSAEAAPPTKRTVVVRPAAPARPVRVVRPVQRAPEVRYVVRQGRRVAIWPRNVRPQMRVRLQGRSVTVLKVRPRRVLVRLPDGRTTWYAR